MPSARLAGVLLILLPITLWSLFPGLWSSSPYLAMEISASSLVVVVYGVLLAINPTMWRIMLPYASLYALGLVSPLIMLDTLGAPLAIFSSYIAQGITNALGIHVAWQGVTFEFVSLTGDPISAVVTPACSAVYSISIYLALLALMYLDLRSSVATTVKFAIVGVPLIPLLDSARIAVNVWFGFLEGSSAFWAIHDWLGYTIFFAFYIAVLVVYSRTASHSETAKSAHL